jgi:O-methyltransferase
MVSFEDLLQKYPIISDQVSRAELTIILRELQAVLDKHIPGSVVEFGCFSGTTSLFIQRLLRDTDHAFHVYDSFEGLPEKTTEDLSPAGEQFKKGELAASKQQFVQNFKKAGLRLPVTHKGLFRDLAPTDVPAQIAFAFLDGDYYASIGDSLRLIEKSLSPGGTLIIDDYANEALPGAAKAVDEWLINKGYRLRVQSSLAVITL